MSQTNVPKVYEEHFIKNLSIDDAKLLFKVSVNVIEMAISSYCNRRCKYCPNYIVDRYTTNTNMSNELFYSILTQLKSIDYSGDISIHRYNEPLADKIYALQRLSSIRTYLPNAKILLSTNGDYLDDVLMQYLSDVGVNVLTVTIHANNPDSPFELLKEQMINKVEKLGIKAEYQIYDEAVHAFLRVKDMNVHYLAVNFFSKDNDDTLKMAFDRGGYINNNGYIRKKPCSIPFSQMLIEYDGTLQPCCNIHSDLDFHANCMLGKITEHSNIFKEWSNDKYVDFRKKMYTNEVKPSPCTHCNTVR